MREKLIFETHCPFSGNYVKSLISFVITGVRVCRGAREGWCIGVCILPPRRGLNDFDGVTEKLHLRQMREKLHTTLHCLSISGRPRKLS